MESNLFTDIINTQLFLLTLTVGVYYGAMRLYRWKKWMLLNPLLISMLVIIAFLKLTGIDYQAYYQANEIINFMLGLSVVALGYLLYHNFEYIKGREISILCSVFTGSVVGVMSVIVIAWLFGMDHVISASLQPKSVTTPIAIALSLNAGGIPALTSVAVIVAGILGSVIGPATLSVLGVHDPASRGLALGAASHAIGTAKAVELGAVEGAFAGASIGLMGVMTAVIIPIIAKILF